jgi:hypothetical protein
LGDAIVEAATAPPTALPFAADSAGEGAPGCEGPFGIAQQRLLWAMDQGSMTVYAFGLPFVTGQVSAV